MPNASCKTFAIGAKQFVVHEALEITVILGVSIFSLTPYTMVASAPSVGAETNTLRAPAAISWIAFSLLAKWPVHSIATSTPWNGTLAGSFSAETLIGP